MELGIGEGFYQPVRNHLRGWNVLEVDLPKNHFVINVVVLDVDMPYLIVINRVVGKDDGSLIVTFERDGGIC